MAEKRTSARSDPLASKNDSASSVRRGLRRLSRRATTLILDFFVIKPIAIFVWVFSQCANDLRFQRRRELLSRMKRALAEGRPVVVATNHVSWFDDPVIPMALYRTGQRAFFEFAAIGGFILAWSMYPIDFLPAGAGAAVGVAGAVVIAWFGARKTWWTLGDLVNLSDASVLEGKFALTRKAPPGALLRALLALADFAIPRFMRSGSTKTLFVDRRPGEEAKRRRARALAATIELAERLEPIWVFFEGGRSKVPGIIAPARRGIGSLVLGLRGRGHQPLVVVIYHRGMERLIPPGGSRFLSYGHQVKVCWSLFDLDSLNRSTTDAQAIADAMRESALQLQSLENVGDSNGG